MQQLTEANATSHIATPFAQIYFHGTKADLEKGDLIKVGFQSNYYSYVQQVSLGLLFIFPVFSNTRNCSR